MVSVILSLILFFSNLFFPALRPSVKSGVAKPVALAARNRLLKAYAGLPLSFEVNQGQTDRSVKFLSRAQGYTLFLEPGEAVLALEKKSEVRSQKSEEKTRTTASVLRMRLVGANLSATASGSGELPSKSNYLVGNDPRLWRTNIATYRKVRFSNIYSGVDLVYYGTKGQLEYDFVVAPGADPANVLLNLKGGTPSVSPEGDLVVRVSGGEVVFWRPRAYQEAAGNGSRIQNVKAEYVLSAPNRVSFRIAKYDPRKALIIDPVLSYGTYLGGNQGDAALGIAIDTSGDAYVTGYTASTNFPAPSGFQTAKKAGVDAFITKVNPTGTALLYSTYLGGGGDDKGAGIAVDTTGNAYVVGTTSSTDFPTAPTASATTTPPTLGAFQTAYGGHGDAFVTKLGPTGATLLYSSYLGGSQADFGFAIAIDSTGNAYVTGSTQSTDFPTLTPFQGGNDGATDAFVAKVNPTGTAMLYSTYLGGSNTDSGQGIAVDSSGNAYITGYTLSANFPTASPLQPANAGGTDVFITKLSPTGSSLVYSTYLGGSGQDRGAAIALDTTQNAYVTGDTLSSNFPVLAGVVQPTNNGNDDAFVLKLNAAGSALVYSTFLGGTGLDEGNAIAVDSSGDAYITGFTQSSDLPRSNPVQETLGGGTCGTAACADAFVAELNPLATALLFSTYLGGNAADFGQAIAVDTGGNAYVAGVTNSGNFPAVAGAFQGSAGDTAGDGDAFVVKIAPTNAAGVALTPQKLSFGNQVVDTASGVQTVTLTNVGTAPLHITGVTAPGDFSETNNCIGTIAPSGGACTISITYTPTSLATVTEVISIADDAAGSPQQITATGTGVNPTTTVSLSPPSLSFANQSVNTTSPAQSVTITNTGTTTLTITTIAASGDFAQTNTCPAATAIPIGGSCRIIVTFTPTTTGARTGSITIADNAAGSPQSVGLTGTGISGFSLSVPAPSQIISIGATTTTFVISAAGPASITSAITFSCAGLPTGATCTFSPTSITVGQTTTLTIAGLTAGTSNLALPPLNFTVNGAGASQTAVLPLTIFFADFSVAASPALNTVAAGTSSTYTVTVTGTNGFNQAVLLSCAAASMPAGAACVFSPSAVSLNGVTNSTAKLTVTTTARAGINPQPRSKRTGPPSSMPKGMLIIFCCLLVILAAGRIAGFAMPSGVSANGSRRVPLNALALMAIVLLLVVGVSSGCSNNFQQLIFPGTTTGTPALNYTIIIEGTLSGGTQVTRVTSVNLAVS